MKIILVVFPEWKIRREFDSEGFMRILKPAELRGWRRLGATNLQLSLVTVAGFLRFFESGYFIEASAVIMFQNGLRRESSTSKILWRHTEQEIWSVSISLAKWRLLTGPFFVAKWDDPLCDSLDAFVSFVFGAWIISYWTRCFRSPPRVQLCSPKSSW